MSYLSVGGLGKGDDSKNNAPHFVQLHQKYVVRGPVNLHGQRGSSEDLEVVAIATAFVVIILMSFGNSYGKRPSSEIYLRLRLFEK